MNKTSSLLRESSEKFFRDIYQGLIKANMYTISKKLEIFTEYLSEISQIMTEYMKERLCQREYETKTTQSVHNRGHKRVASQPTKSASCFGLLKKEGNKYGYGMDISQTFIGIFCHGHITGHLRGSTHAK
jgi:hypothetical protein